MGMEEETLLILNIGIVVTMLLYVGFILNNLFRKKNKIFVWFLLHSITMSISIYYYVSLLYSNYHRTINPTVISESNSLNIGLSAVFWSISIFILIIGISLLKRRGSNESNS